MFANYNNMAKKHNNTRNFSSADSVLYNGALYPSSTVLMDNGNGVVKDSKIFIDSNGQYYTMGDNGMAYPVMLQHELPEVEVKPSQEEMLSRSLRNSLTLSQDNARVSNPLNPYESFNTHLRERALRGEPVNMPYGIRSILTYLHGETLLQPYLLV